MMDFVFYLFCGIYLYLWIGAMWVDAQVDKLYKKAGRDSHEVL